MPTTWRMARSLGRHAATPRRMSMRPGRPQGPRLRPTPGAEQHVRHRRHRRHRARQPADLRRADGAAAPRPGCRGHHDRPRRPAVRCARTPAWSATCSRQRHMLRPPRQRRHRPRPLPDGRQRGRRRGPAVLRQRALRHRPRHNGNLTNAAEQAEALWRDDRRHLNTDLGLRGAAQRASPANCSASARPQRLAPSAVFAALTRCIRRCRGGYAVVALLYRPRRARLPRPERHPPAGARPPRHAARAVEWMLASESVALDLLRLQAGARRRAGRGRLHRGGRLPCTRSASRRRARTRRASSSTSISRAPTASSTTSRCTRRACAWATSWRRRSAASARCTTSTSSSRSRTPAAPARCSWRRRCACKYREGFVKNRYIGRTFIMPGQEQRKKSVRSQAQRHRPRVPQPQRAAGRRLHRPRHHLGADHRAGARGRRAQGLLRLGGAAGALPERLRHRHAGRRGARRQRPHATRKSPR